MIVNPDKVLTGKIISCAIEVHRQLGAGLLESAYEKCLCHELGLRGIVHARQVALPVVYKGLEIDAGYWMDIVVEGQVIVELKAVEGILPVHEALLLTYLRLSGHRLGLLLNFNVPVLKDGIRRIIL